MIDPWTKLAPPGTFSRKPPLKSSRTTTSCPLASKCAATCDPIKPAPPVTNDVGIFFMCDFLLRNGGREQSAFRSGSLYRDLLHWLLDPMFDELNRIQLPVPNHCRAVHFQAALGRIIRPEQIRQPVTDLSETELRQHHTAVLLCAPAPIMLVKITIPVTANLDRES